MNLSDDIFSWSIQIGFSFNFYGNSFLKCIASSNGYLSFDTTFAGQSSYYPLQSANPLPDSSAPLNSIMASWSDLNPSLSIGGEISFGTFGIMPNRFFVLNYCSVPSFWCNNNFNNLQIILFENSNIIEIHVGEKDICTTMNNDFAVEGLQNSSATSASIVPGRNYPSQWSTYNDARRFTPNATYTDYTIDSIAFAPVPMIGYPSWILDSVVIGMGPTISVTPLQTTTYHLTTSGCSNFDDSIKIYTSTFDTSFSIHNPICPDSEGYIGFECSNGTGPYNFVWENTSYAIIQTTTNSGTDTLSGLAHGTYHLFVTDSAGCTDPGTMYLYNFVITNPQNFTFGNVIVDASCLICNDGSVTVNIAGGTPPYLYLWNTGDSTPTILNEPPGTYFFTVTDNNGCVSYDTVFISVANGIANINSISSFEISPNPAHDKIILSGKFLNNENISVTDLLGRALIEIEINATSEKQIIDITSLNEGIYILKFQTPNSSSEISKFVKK